MRGGLVPWLYVCEPNKPSLTISQPKGIGYGVLMSLRERTRE